MPSEFATLAAELFEYTTNARGVFLLTVANAAFANTASWMATVVVLQSNCARGLPPGSRCPFRPWLWTFRGMAGI